MYCLQCSDELLYTQDMIHHIDSVKTQLPQTIDVSYKKLELIQLDIGQQLSKSVSVRAIKAIRDGDEKSAFFAVFNDSVAKFKVSKDRKIEQLENSRLQKSGLNVFDAEPTFVVYQRKTALFRQEEEQDIEQDAQ